MMILAKFVPKSIKTSIYNKIKEQVEYETKSQVKKEIEAKLSTTSNKQKFPPGTKKADYGNGNIVYNHPKLLDSKIIFQGSNNIIYMRNNQLTIYNSKIVFGGDNSVLYIGKHTQPKRKQRTNIYIHDSSCVYIGNDVNFHIGHEIYIVAAENKNIIIGDDCLFSLDIWMRTSDGHALYDTKSKKRLNTAKSILVGDHVWIGQKTTILKGSQIGSGSTIGAGSIVSNKKISSNTVSAGAPVKELGSSFFEKADVNKYKPYQIDQINHCKTTDFIYKKSSHNTIDFDSLDKDMSSAETSREKLNVIKNRLVNNTDKNKFYI